MCVGVYLIVDYLGIGGVSDVDGVLSWVWMGPYMVASIAYEYSSAI
jgi:hypothetical protein